MWFQTLQSIQNVHCNVLHCKMFSCRFIKFSVAVIYVCVPRNVFHAQILSFLAFYQNKRVLKCCWVDTLYSVLSNKSGGWNKRGGYYIGLFGHYIKNHVLFNKFFWKKSKNSNRACTLIRNCRVQVLREKKTII